jgi:ATP-binding cassette subfamily F protein 3
LGTYDDFLAREGWEDEQDESSKAAKKATKQASASQRSKPLRTTNKAGLSSLKRELEQIEEKIIVLEEKNATLAKALEAPSNNNPDHLRSISEEYQCKQAMINELFERMEVISSNISAIEGNNEQ